jgi:hypothetical protein
MSTFSLSHLSPFIDLQPDLRYHTSAIFASALEVATGFQRISSSFVTHADSRSFDLNTPDSRVAADSTSDGNWVAELTKSYQHRLCGLEACLPFPIYPSTDESFAPLWDLLSHSQRGQAVCNPFMSSLSAAVWGGYAATETVLRSNRAHPSETNVINCRGFQSSGLSSHPSLPHLLSAFSSHFESLVYNSPTPYRVTSLHQRSYGLPIPLSFPSIFHGVDQEGFLSFPVSTPPSQIASVLFPSTSGERVRGSSRISCDSLVGMTGPRSLPAFSCPLLTTTGRRNGI